MVWQEERGEGGTLHLQGVCCLVNACTLAAMKRRIPRAHLEVMRGTLDEAVAYCSKEDTRVSGPFSFGERPPGAGARTDIHAAMAMVKEGKRELEIAEEQPGVWLRYNKALERYRRLLTPARSWQTTALALWGPPGSGKSRRAFELGGASQFWLVRPRDSRGSVWWDGYEGQDLVVIDEFYGWMSRDMVQRIVDRYPLVVETKGGAVAFVAKKVVFTSNKHPRDWWRIGLGAMERRLADPIGSIEYVGNERYPNAQDYLDSDEYGGMGAGAVGAGFAQGNANV